jgi:hypothetical protein
MLKCRLPRWLEPLLEVSSDFADHIPADLSLVGRLMARIEICNL